MRRAGCIPDLVLSAWTCRCPRRRVGWLAAFAPVGRVMRVDGSILVEKAWHDDAAGRAGRGAERSMDDFLADYVAGDGARRGCRW
jgi:hypothetical protein